MTGNAPESRMWRLLDVSTAERAATHYVTIYTYLLHAALRCCMTSYHPRK